MNPYHDNDAYGTGGYLAAEALRHGGIIGESAIRKAYQSSSSYEERQRYVTQVSWALYTPAYLSSLVRLLDGKSVLEVCAGRGILGKIMPDLGVPWVCTDLLPPIGANHVRRMGAVAAVRKIPHDVVFASWVPYESTLDYQLALTGPCVFIGEGSHGCTGSNKFWGSHYHKGRHRYVEADRPYVIQGMPDWFVDVPQWPAIHDYTFRTVLKVS